MTRQQQRALKAAEKELRMSISEEDRYLGSVFVNSVGTRQHQERVTRAYTNYRRLGGSKDI
jgi:hypothetical protein